MRKILKVIIYFFVGILSLVGLFLIYLLIPGTEKVDAVFIPNANFAVVGVENLLDEQLEFKNPEKKPVHLLQLHRLAIGSGVVLGVRKYSNPNKLVWDDESFQKISVHLPKLEVGTVNLTQGSSAQSYFTRGGSAFPFLNCGGEIENGQIEVLFVETDTVRAKIKGDVHCRRRNANSGDSIHIEEDHIFELMQVDEVTPWIGKAGKHIYDESYRR